MSVIKELPIGPGWFILFQKKRRNTGDGFIVPGQSITNFKKYDIQSNNKAIVLTELGVI